VGIEVPLAEDKGRPGIPRWSDIAGMARLAEEAGFDSVWVEDHLIFRHPGRPAQGVWEGWALLAAIGAVTSRVEIGPLVTCASFRNPALLAAMASTVDEVAGGRLILGLGAGWHEPEYRAFGFPYDHRVSRFEEALHVIRTLLRDGRVDFEGRFHQARDCELRTRSPRPGGPPILIGSIGERMLGLAARHADVWNAYFSHTGNRATGVVPLRGKVDAACRAAGRDPATLRRTAAVYVDMGGGTEGPPKPPNWKVEALTGEPERLAQELRAYAAEGIEHLQLWLEPNTRESVEAFRPVLEALDRS
jgi:alkanesulfonate monooxygenase SsuD/methylene tetrahydromethanopterin reductase-like flavin-dependent oxidoreductase (luciferase family)